MLPANHPLNWFAVLLMVVALFQAIAMLRRAIPLALLALAIVFLLLSEAPAEMGPCRPLGGDVMFRPACFWLAAY